RDLHSFPTRRSSDLCLAGGAHEGERRHRRARGARLVVPAGARGAARDLLAGVVRRMDAGEDRVADARILARADEPSAGSLLEPRSEEHTSELQSPYD